MSHRLPGPPAPGPLETYVQTFDALFAKRTQRAAFRRSLEGRLLSTERNKTLTGLANTAPVVDAQHPAAQRPSVVSQRIYLGARGDQAAAARSARLAASHGAARG